MDIPTIILFLVYTYGLGYTVTSFLKISAHALEKHIMRVGIGLGVLPILLIILNFFRVPLDWRILLSLSVAYPAYVIFKYRKFNAPSFKVRKSDVTVFIVVLIFFATFGMYLKGAFSYPYLENEDPWGHSVGVKYVALEKKAYDPVVHRAEMNMDPVLSYIDPYPPAYDALMGILHQTNDSVNWTLKFFNALIISLGIVFFYFFAKEFVGGRNRALYATIILAMIPCYLSHFIWAHSLVITLIFPLFYTFEKSRYDPKWAYIGGIVFASIWVTQNLSQPLKISTLLFIYIVVGSITRNKFMKSVTFASFFGLLLAGIWWGAMIFKYGFGKFITYYVGSGAVTEVASGAVTNTSILLRILSIIPKLFSPGGTASRSYVMDDFIIAKTTNLINNPIGVGLVLSLLVIFSVILVLLKNRSNIVTKENTWMAVTLLWLLFTFLGVNGVTFDIKIARGAFRVWMLMAIPVALISSEGISCLKKSGKKYKIPFAIIFLLLFGGIWATSGYQKYVHYTNPGWPTSGSFSGGEASEPWQYGAWFNSLEPNTKVFLYAPRDKLTIGYDAFSCDWCQEVIDFRGNILNFTVDQLYGFLK
ncbi:MAG: hypothetical protein KJ601_06505, partial [Nanoarchaeota archaeon]|nr:hypothetical protein [Nanoarchaeota archaeon]